MRRPTGIRTEYRKFEQGSGMARMVSNMSEHKRKTPIYSMGEEIANSITHGVGVVFGVVGLTVLVTLAAIYGDAWRVVSFSIYGATLILLYLVSTLYHSFPQPRVKHIFRTLDHAAIYLFIAGTYTPFMLLTVRGVLGWTLLTIVWSLAALGAIWKLFFIGRFKAVALAAYIFMGWIAVIAVKPMVTNLSTAGISLVVAGGVVYTLGVLFYKWRRLPYNHAIWHLFVLAASICHFFAVVTLASATA